MWNALPAEVKKSENLHHFKKNITQWCALAKCDVFIIQWYTWYIYVYIYHVYIYIYIYITLYEIYHIILSVLSIAVFIIHLHVTFIEPSRFLCEIQDVECIVYD